MRIRDLPGLLWLAFQRWLKSDPAPLAASIAYHAVLSLAPLLVLLLATAARIVGATRARGELLELVAAVGGRDAVPVAETMLRNIVHSRASALTTAFGVLIMLNFASLVIVEIRGALDRVWEVRSTTTFRGALWGRAVSVLLVPAAIALLLLTLLLGLLGSVASPFVAEVLPHAELLWSLGTTALSFVLSTAVLALVYRHGPNVRITWRDVLGGAVLTAVVFTAGNTLIGVVVRRSLLVSLYGTFGALIVVLLWVFYGAQILLFGAHVTRAYAERFGSRAPETEVLE